MSLKECQGLEFNTRDTNVCYHKRMLWWYDFACSLLSWSWNNCSRHDTHHLPTQQQHQPLPLINPQPTDDWCDNPVTGAIHPHPSSRKLQLPESWLDVHPGSRLLFHHRLHSWYHFGNLLLHHVLVGMERCSRPCHDRWVVWRHFSRRS